MVHPLTPDASDTSIAAEIRSDTSCKPPVLHVGGELDLGAVDALAEALAALLEAPAPELVVDVTDLRFIDCAGLGPLLSAHRSATARSGDVRLRGESRGVSRLLHLLDRAGQSRPALLQQLP